ncbi:hypothetical protein BRADI_3g43295v3 [Brachypodium distachyon]|uniref:Uncharacterized protein n=1 Tax=Brachypodium distachyon TaxID=15368 RepID=A0A0Q3IFQ2_BRADI|nr:hypothetical protein BRADI_3g43295v3 [Brachypodium distachyon]
MEASQAFSTVPISSITSAFSCRCRLLLLPPPTTAAPRRLERGGEAKGSDSFYCCRRRSPVRRSGARWGQRQRPCPRRRADRSWRSRALGSPVWIQWHRGHHGRGVQRRRGRQGPAVQRVPWASNPAACRDPTASAKVSSPAAKCFVA